MSDKCILDPERYCLGLMKAQELEKDFDDFRQRNEKSHKEFFNRLASLESHDKLQALHYTHIMEKLSDITDRLSSLSSRIATIEFKPAKRYEGIVEKIIGLVVAAVVGYFMAKLGLK